MPLLMSHFRHNVAGKNLKDRSLLLSCHQQFIYVQLAIGAYLFFKILNSTFHNILIDNLSYVKNVFLKVDQIYNLNKNLAIHFNFEKHNFYYYLRM